MNVSKQSSNAGHELKIDDMSEEMLLIDLTDDESARVNGGVYYEPLYDSTGFPITDIYDSQLYNCIPEYLEEVAYCSSYNALNIPQQYPAVTPTDFGV